VIESVRLGTRGSALARRQTGEVEASLRAAYPSLEISVEIISTQGDQHPDAPLAEFGNVGAFTSALEGQLRAGAIDLAVHSYKDLPTRSESGVVVAAVPPRRNPADVLVSKGGYRLETLPLGATVGTGSPRRAAQLLNQRPDLRILDIRGNVDTRVSKALAQDGIYDAIVLAYAGLERLERLEVISEVLSQEVMLPAPAQAALAVQCRDDVEWRTLLEPINHLPTECAVAAERAFLSMLEAGCALPVAAYGVVEDNQLRLSGRVISVEGATRIDVSDSAPFSDVQAAQRLGEQLAELAKAQGGAAILEAAR
jgi:hydroxymethylbilane synthase